MGRDWSVIESSLQGIDRYNPDNIPLLEEYVQYQIEEKKYNLDANLALLKLLAIFIFFSCFNLLFINFIHLKDISSTQIIFKHWLQPMFFSKL
jgi:translation initiation factor 3 subunit K